MSDHPFGYVPAFQSSNAGYYGDDLWHYLTVLEQIPDRLIDMISTPMWSTGLSLLHAAIAHRDKKLVQKLIDLGVRFQPDMFGRMPSALAVECGVPEDLLDIVVDAEARTKPP